MLNSRLSGTGQFSVWAFFTGRQTNPMCQTTLRELEFKDQDNLSNMLSFQFLWLPDRDPKDESQVAQEADAQAEEEAQEDARQV